MKETGQGTQEVADLTVSTLNTHFGTRQNLSD